MPVAIEDRDEILQIKSVLESQYTDGITAFTRVELDDEDNIIGIFEDKISPTITKRYAFKITDNDIGYRLMNASEISNFLETGDKMNELDFEERQKQLEIQQAELAKQAQILAKRQAELDRKEDLDFCEGLIKEGKVLPKERTNLMAIFSSLRKSDSTVNFGEGDLSAVEAVKNFVKEHPPVIAFGEFSAPEKALPRSNSNFDVPDGYDVDPDQLELHQKAEAYMEAHPGTDFLKAIQKIGG